MNSTSRAILMGIMLSAVAVGLIGSLQPDTPVHLSRNPLADYRALATAPDVSLLVTYLWTAFLVGACLFVSAWHQEKRCRARALLLAEAAEPEEITEEEPCLR
jgi:uncharacterized BrkB/YihY/UPF0761 family membrane protein